MIAAEKKNIVGDIFSYMLLFIVSKFFIFFPFFLLSLSNIMVLTFMLIFKLQDI